MKVFYSCMPYTQKRSKENFPLTFRRLPKCQRSFHACMTQASRYVILKLPIPQNRRMGNGARFSYADELESKRSSNCAHVGSAGIRSVRCELTSGSLATRVHLLQRPNNESAGAAVRKARGSIRSSNFPRGN